MSKQTKKQRAHDNVVENAAETVESAVNEVEQAESSSQDFTEELETEKTDAAVDTAPVEKEINGRISFFCF